MFHGDFPGTGWKMAFTIVDDDKIERQGIPVNVLEDFVDSSGYQLDPEVESGKFFEISSRILFQPFSLSSS